MTRMSSSEGPSGVAAHFRPLVGTLMISLAIRLPVIRSGVVIVLGVTFDIISWRSALQHNYARMHTHVFTRENVCPSCSNGVAVAAGA